MENGRKQKFPRIFSTFAQKIQIRNPRRLPLTAQMAKGRHLATKMDFFG